MTYNMIQAEILRQIEKLGRATINSVVNALNATEWETVMTEMGTLEDDEYIETRCDRDSCFVHVIAGFAFGEAISQLNDQDAYDADCLAQGPEQDGPTDGDLDRSAFYAEDIYAEDDRARALELDEYRPRS